VTATRVGRVLDSLRLALDLPALAGAVVTGSGVEADAVGARRAGGPNTVTAGDRFHLGSNTKALTAALLATYVAEGRLAWTTRLADALPALAAGMRAEYRDVTVRELLAHGAGLTAATVLDRDPPGATPAAQRLAVAADALGRPPAGPRGTFLYSNAGYVIAGLVAEQLGGAPYEALLARRVLAPLGVTTAGFGAMGTPGREDQPLQHAVDAAGRRTAVGPGAWSNNPSAYAPAGLAHMSVGDWGRVVQGALAAAQGSADAPDPFRGPAAAALAAPVLDAGAGARAALGWLVVDRAWAGGPALTHSGSNLLNYSVAWVAPGRDFAVLVATNQGDAGERTARAVDAVAGRLIQLHLTGR
jgi:CubicO group peptidase (beta-lactamase class C family)